MHLDEIQEQVDADWAALLERCDRELAAALESPSYSPEVSARRNPDNVAAALVLFVLLAVGGALLGGVFLGRATKSTTTITVAAATTVPAARPVNPDVAAGAHDFVNFACAQCHGLDGRGGSPQPSRPSRERRR